MSRHAWWGPGGGGRRPWHVARAKHKPSAAVPEVEKIVGRSGEELVAASLERTA
jgi:hypothetical protein